MRKSKPKPIVKKPKFTPKGGRPCPVHSIMLVFHPDQMTWECPADTCRYKEFPDAIDGNVPVQARGKTYLVVTEDDDGDKTYLLMSENNVFFKLDREQIAFTEGALPTINIAVDGVKIV